MVPGDSGTARCPACDSVEAVATRLPLFVLTGASGAGKSTLLPLLLSRLSGRCAVFDVDWLIDPLGGASGVDWVTFRDAWLHVAHGIAQNGLPTLLLGPLVPGHLDALPGRQWVSEMHFAVLDCSDQVRRSRIEARPGWRARDLAQQLEFAEWLRAYLRPVFDTDLLSPEDTADAVTAWVLATTGSVLDPAVNG